jgi:hypothetical protein
MLAAVNASSKAHVSCPCFYATTPGSAAHAAEVAWFAKHGVSIIHDVRQVERR